MAAVTIRGKWTVFVGGLPYVIEADAMTDNGIFLAFSIEGKIMGRFMWEQIDGYVEVK